MTQSVRLEAVERALERWNAGDLGGYLTLYAPTVLLHGYTPEPMNFDSTRAFYESFCAAFPTSRLEFHDVLETDERVVIRFTVQGRHDGDFMGVSPTGREIALPGITILRFDGPTCVERWSSADMLGLLVQLGAVPVPA